MPIAFASLYNNAQTAEREGNSPAISVPYSSRRSTSQRTGAHTGSAQPPCALPLPLLPVEMFCGARTRSSRDAGIVLASTSAEDAALMLPVDASESCRSWSPNCTGTAQMAPLVLVSHVPRVALPAAIIAATSDTAVPPKPTAASAYCRNTAPARCEFAAVLLLLATSAARSAAAEICSEQCDDPHDATIDELTFSAQPPPLPLGPISTGTRRATAGAVPPSLPPTAAPAFIVCPFASTSHSRSVAVSALRSDDRITPPVEDTLGVHSTTEPLRFSAAGCTFSRMGVAVVFLYDAMPGAESTRGLDKRKPDRGAPPAPAPALHICPNEALNHRSRRANMPGVVSCGGMGRVALSTMGADAFAGRKIPGTTRHSAGMDRTVAVELSASSRVAAASSSSRGWRQTVGLSDVDKSHTSKSFLDTAFPHRSCMAIVSVMLTPAVALNVHAVPLIPVHGSTCSRGQRGAAFTVLDASASKLLLSAESSSSTAAPPVDHTKTALDST